MPRDTHYIPPLTPPLPGAAGVMCPGVVAFAGSGPGDADLLTLKVEARSQRYQRRSRCNQLRDYLLFLPLGFQVIFLSLATHRASVFTETNG